MPGSARGCHVSPSENQLSYEAAQRFSHRYFGQGGFSLLGGRAECDSWPVFSQIKDPKKPLKA
jgi:hypothetical protein